VNSPTDHWLYPILFKFYADRRNFKKYGNNKDNAYAQAIMEIEAGMYDFSKITRLEVVDHTPCKNCKGVGYVEGIIKKEECKRCFGMGSPGRTQIFWDANKQIQLSLQDDDQTLKIFIKEREKV
jgi:DnaJ-class molecular chaperone